MNIHMIGSVRGLPHSRTSSEDIAREFAPRFVKSGHKFTVHVWWLNPEEPKITQYKGAKVVRHKAPQGKYGQIIINIKATIYACLSDCDTVFYLWINNSVLSFLPRLFGKKVFANLNGMIWHDPKWPWGIRHIFFNFGALLSYFTANKVITDARNMVTVYKRRFKINMDWIGYGCQDTLIEKKHIDVNDLYPEGYYLIMSRITPHNLTDLLIKGFILSNSKKTLLIAGETPKNKWFDKLLKLIEGKKIKFLGLVKDQQYLDQLILNADAYLHGHSLGGINPALVRVTASNTVAICIDTVFNREVLELSNQKELLCFDKNPESLSNQIIKFEEDNSKFIKDSIYLGKIIREKWNWNNIYKQYLNMMEKR